MVPFVVTIQRGASKIIDVIENLIETRHDREINFGAAGICGFEQGRELRTVPRQIEDALIQV